jgi:hypothetical protein
LGASALLAFALVVTVLAILLRWFYEPRSPEQAMAEDLLQGVEVLDLEQNPRLREAVERAGMDVGKLEKREPPPKPALPERMVKGFVQLEFTVDEEGVVKDARVIGAVPKGYYEAEALAQIGRKVYMPTYQDGEPVASKRTEIVQFELPAKRR